jgi:hypothetical protein
MYKFTDFSLALWPPFTLFIRTAATAGKPAGKKYGRPRQSAKFAVYKQFLARTKLFSKLARLLQMLVLH